MCDSSLRIASSIVAGVICVGDIRRRRTDVGGRFLNFESRFRREIGGREGCGGRGGLHLAVSKDFYSLHFPVLVAITGANAFALAGVWLLRRLMIEARGGGAPEAHKPRASPRGCFCLPASILAPCTGAEKYIKSILKIPICRDARVRSQLLRSLLTWGSVGPLTEVFFPIGDLPRLTKTVPQCTSS